MTLWVPLFKAHISPSDMEKELKAFQKHLHVQAASDESSSDIKVWDMKDLGLQATTKIATAKG